MNEFEMIERYFLPLSMGRAEVAGFKDDAAVLEVPKGHELVITSDTLNEGVHFMIGESAENIAHKVLRVNLSDLAAMGAEPLSYQLNIAFPEKPDESWLAEFSSALLADNEAFDIFCSGGDTTSIKSSGLSISITVLGTVPRGRAVRRGGAKGGDLIVLTGAVGDAYLGLKSLQSDGGYSGAVGRYRIPQPRNVAAKLVREYASAAIDISDGLLSDVMHIADSSGLGAEIDLERIVLSDEVRSAIDVGVVELGDVISGGDDYELAMAVPPDNLQCLIIELKKLKLNPLVIGEFKSEGLGLELLNKGSIQIDDKNLGWKHF